MSVRLADEPSAGPREQDWSRPSNRASSGVIPSLRAHPAATSPDRGPLPVWLKILLALVILAIAVLIVLPTRRLAGGSTMGVAGGGAEDVDEGAGRGPAAAVRHDGDRDVSSEPDQRPVQP